MDTSAVQLHQKKLNINPQKGKDKRLFIDLDVCANGVCKDCVIKCSYLYHPQNSGIVSIAELATYALVCRRCDEPHCVNACHHDALKQQNEKDKLLTRHNMRCVSCISCSHACPYGTIYPENVPLMVHNCDFCLDRRQTRDEPLCISSCPHGALSLREADAELPEYTFLVGDNIIVHATRWERNKA